MRQRKILGAEGEGMEEEDLGAAAFRVPLTVGGSVPAGHKPLLFSGPRKASGTEMP